MTLPAGYYRIDPDIRALVAAMNVHGFRTYASCQGHGFPVTKLPPYIAFVCPVKKAALLEQRLRQDAESMMPRLLWGWSVGASLTVTFSSVSGFSLKALITGITGTVAAHCVQTSGRWSAY